MNTTAKVIRYEMRDVIRGRALLLYSFLLLIAGDLLFRFGGGSSRTLLSLSSLTLLVVPLISIVLGTMFVYNAREFNELLLSQPVSRRQLFAGLYLGLSLPLVLGFIAAIAIPVAVHGVEEGGLRTVGMLLIAGTFLTAIFTALAFAVALRIRDRVRGMGAALLLYIFLAVGWDALVLVFANTFHDIALERPLLALILMNPVDLARVVLMLDLDVAALMGYTGLVFENFFGRASGLVVALAALGVWLAAPLFAASRNFATRDFS